MHIKRINLQGFKSYKTQSSTDEFSPHFNVVVGRNGSGKSNFFSAIQFVLTDRYSKLSRQERQQLLHEGSGTAVMSAYVEIVFDNRDRRINEDSDEVAVRRTIGGSKDDFSINGRSATHIQVASMLETSGFSKSNPYYIVPQGDIISLTVAKDSDRLKLLREVAGTELYEKRKRDSIKLLETSEDNRQKIAESLERIEQRISELEQDKDLLREYYNLDGERRALDYTLNSRELAEANELLLTLESTRADELAVINNKAEELNDCQEQIDALESAAASRVQTEAALTADLSELSRERASVVAEAATAELSVQQALQAQTQTQGRVNDLRRGLQLTRNQRQDYQRDLEAHVPVYARHQQAEADLRLQLAALEARQQHLEQKQGQASQFQSKIDRDAWIRIELDDIAKSMAERQTAISRLEAEVRDLTAQQDSGQAEVVALETRSDELQASLASHQDQLSSLHSTISHAQDLRDGVWRQEARAAARLEALRSAVQKAEGRVNDTMARNMTLGVRAVDRLTDQLGLGDRVFGMVADLFQVSDQYKTAVEVCAGNSLFNIVVDSDETASILIREMARSNSGRATFMPLNRLRPRTVQFPDESVTDAIPMVSRLEYDPKFDPAMSEVFGQALVCQDLETCQQYAHTYNLSAITLAGDKVDSRGLLTGGYRDKRQSRLDAVQALKAAQKELREAEEELETLRGRSKEYETQLAGHKAEHHRLEAEHRRLAAEISQARDQARTKRQELESVVKLIQTRIVSLEAPRQDLVTLKSQHDSYSADLNSPWQQALSDQEMQELQSTLGEAARLRTQLQVARQALAAADQTRSDLETRVAQLELEVPQIEEQLRIELESSGTDRQLEFLQSQLQSRNHKVEELDQQMAALSEQLDQLRQERDTAAAKMTEAQQQFSALANELGALKTALEDTVERRSAVVDRKDQLQAKIRELGVLPEDARARYSSHDSRQLVERRRVVTQELRRFRNVNKRAVEQYASYTRDREAYLKRQDEISRSRDSIHELIHTLDLRKDEATSRTFKQVSQAFSRIFEKLVPAGKGRLILQRRLDQEPSESAASGFNVDNYSGVSISVSFHSQHDEQQRIEQLSGGQKSLCALTLIFAIQQADPGPFYLFDEVDANLDPQYRAAVAGVIRDYSKEAQYICTTFREEMLQVADRFYGVVHDHGMSSTVGISKESAMSFVEGQSRS